MNILIIGPSWVGDMVMSQSLYINLKHLYPDASIDVLAPAWCKPILERMPEINQALEMPIGHGEFNLSARKKLGHSLRENQYDKAYILPNSAKSALIPWFAKVPTRIGWTGEYRFGLLNDIRHNKKQFQYMVERYVALSYPKSEMVNSQSLGGLNSLPKPALTVDASLQLKTIEKLGLNPKQKVLGLCPGAEFGPAKQWPVEHYAKVAQNAIENGFDVWLFGSVKDQPTTSAIIDLLDDDQQSSAFDLAGKTSLIEVVDLLGACKTVVSNDSGLMHVAAAVGCHVIGVYGSTSPRYTPPLAEKVDIKSIDMECRPCFKRTCKYGHLNCLKNLHPELIIASLDVN